MKFIFNLCYVHIHIHIYIHEHNHNIDFEHPKILCNDSNKMRLLVKETLSIIGQSANKSLNVNVKSFECKLW